MNDYAAFIERKSQSGAMSGFDPVWMPEFLFDFQKMLVEWAVRRGRAAIFSDCGTGKTAMQLVWAENIVRKTNGRVLIVTPLAVGPQTIGEAQKFGISATRSRDGAVNGSGIYVTNYEQLHKFDPTQFIAMVCDESSILKHFTGATQKQVTRFMSKLCYRLLCTATAAPNDYPELGTSSEALGELSYSEMLKRFFKYLDDKGQKSDQRLQNEAESIVAHSEDYYQKLAYRIAQTIGQWRLKHHAVIPFWQWIASWARACRMPSDLGFDDGSFILPELIQRVHVVIPESPPEGALFNLPAFGLSEERAERKRTLNQRCDLVASLVKHGDPAVVWCHTNDEADLLENTIPDAEQVSGKTPDEQKIEMYEAFRSGALRVLVIKPKIGAWGLNWQHCAHVVTFATHSYEQHYQSIRRCWRFGQRKPVTVDVIASEGEVRVIANLEKKAVRANRMFAALIHEMNAATRIERVDEYTTATGVPAWL